MPWHTIESGRPAVTEASFIRNEPAAALRGLENGVLPDSAQASLNFSNASVGKNTSPRTSTYAGTGYFLEAFSRCGTTSTVRTLLVTSSPTRPSPRVTPRVSTPSSYVSEMARPSTLSSHRKSAFSAPSRTSRACQESSSSGLNALSRLIIRSRCWYASNVDDA
jgi:hypothetical protein